MRKLIGWTVKFVDSGEGFCNHHNQVITCGIKGYKEQNFIRLLLHEIAHIPKIIKRTHGKAFQRRFEASCKKYLGSNKLTKKENRDRRRYCDYSKK